MIRLVLGLVCAIALPALQADAAPSRPIAYSQVRLSNGMRLILAPDRSVPVVTFSLMIPVGSRQEAPGRSGFAHLFEHLMFEGSKHVKKGGFDRILESQGAENNASVHMDFTNFYETLPSNALPVAFWLEADRLSALDVSKKNMLNQISVVKEEKRQNVLNEAYGRLIWVEIASRTFASWANAHDSYGTFEDLDAADLSDVRAFFRDHYAPSNLTAAVVGDFDPAEARTLAERYFAWIPNRGTPPAVDASEAPQRVRRVFGIKDEHAKVPGVAMIWSGMPDRGSRAYRALTLLGKILFEGKSARLYQSLVKDKQVATSIDEPYTGGLGFPVTDWEEYREPGLFGGFILYKEKYGPLAIERLVFSEIARIAREGVRPDELERVKSKFRSEWIVGRQTTLGRAWALLLAAVLDGDPSAANSGLEEFMAVTPEDVRAAAAAHLRPEVSNVFRLSPSPKEGS